MAKDKKPDPSLDNSLSQASKLDAIKEIIFGQEKEDFSRQLSDLSNQLDQRHQDLLLQLEEMKAQFSDQLTSLDQKVSEDLSDLKKHTSEEIGRIDNEKTNREELGKMLVSLGETLLKDGKSS